MKTPLLLCLLFAGSCPAQVSAPPEKYLACPVFTEPQSQEKVAAWVKYGERVTVLTIDNSAINSVKVQTTANVQGYVPANCLLDTLVASNDAQLPLDLTRNHQGSDEIPLPVPPVSQLRPEIQPHLQTPKQFFECDGKFTLEDCKKEMTFLKSALSKYGADQLGDWKWVLVPSQDWELLLVRLGASPVTPAVSVLQDRVTFFDDTLVDGSPLRLSQLSNYWHLGRQGLLDLAVRHELGHAFCHFLSETGANRAAKILDRKKPLSCGAWSRRVNNKTDN